MDVLKNLYPLVAPGGWIILDDWPLPQAKLAIQDFLKAQGLPESVLRVDRVTPEKRPEHAVNGEVPSRGGGEGQGAAPAFSSSRDGTFA